uniref:Uncharacterized protein LOC113795248 n=1 Tax=Dermatophagoides pteronyssinus TaxID=6956 RepID=A0A6P6Y9J2_DERPT|nr:uncharacterized protein LOC113795248 [Dermatophagoides pteronyssinus]
MKILIVFIGIVLVVNGQENSFSVKQTNSIDHHNDDDKQHRSNIIMDKSPSSVDGKNHEDIDDDEEDEDDDEEESISSHVLSISYEMELLRSKIFREFSTINRRQQQQQHDDHHKYDGYQEIFKQITKPLNGLLRILIKLQYDLSEQCEWSLIEWLNSLNEQQLWAFQMFDSNGFIPNSGLLSGPLSNFGSYDQCLAIDTGKIRGQYCMIETRLSRSSSMMNKQQKSELIDSSLNQSNETIWMNLEKNQRLLPAARWYISLCIPSQCTSKDIQYLIDDRKLLAKVKNCHHSGDDNDGDSIRQSIFITSFAIVIIILIIIDRRYFRQNATSNQQNDRIESIIDSIRLINIILIIYWHTYIFTWKSSIRLSLKLFEIFNKLSPIQLMLIGWPLMESMLFLESLRLSYRLFRSSNKNSRINFQQFFYHFIKRWLNLATLLIIMFTIIPSISNGPQSFLSTDQLNECRNEWWQILLFIMNLNPQNKCLSHLWIFVVEFQLFLLIIPFIYLIQRIKLSSKIIISIVSITMITTCTIISSFYYQYNENIQQMILGTMHSELDFQENLFSLNISPLFYLCPYLFGILFGYWLTMNTGDDDSNDNKWPNLSRRIKISMAIILIMSISISFVIIFNQSLHWKPFAASIILGFYRFIWSIWLIILIIFLGNSNVIGKFFPSKSNIFQWLKSLSIQSYLIHYLVIMVRDSKRRQSIVFNHWKMFEEFLLNLLISLLLASIIRYSFTKPLNRTVKFVWKKLSKTITKENKSIPVKSKCSSINSSLSGSYQEVTNIDDNDTNGDIIITNGTANQITKHHPSTCTTIELTSLLSSPSPPSSDSNGKMC